MLILHLFSKSCTVFCFVFSPGVSLYRFAKIKVFPCAKSLKRNGRFGMMDENKPSGEGLHIVCGVPPKFWEAGWIEMEKSKRTFRGSYPAYALTYFFFYWSLGVFTSVLSMYLTGIGKSKAEMSFIMSASSLFGVVLIPIVGYINDKLRKPRLICTVMMACVAVFGILFALVRETMLLFLLNGCIMGFISSLSPVSERMATSTKYRYGTIRIWGTFGYAAAVQVACAMMEFTSP